MLRLTPVFPGRGLSDNAAAATIALSQSATSAALNELEAVLGTKLFDRVGKRLLLNGAGTALLPHTRRLLEDTELIEGRCNGS